VHRWFVKFRAEEKAMAQLAWKERYSVGIPKLDKQHKTLLELVNRISGMDPESVSNKDVFTTLHQLVEYAQYHFDSEEGILAKHHYPKLPQQRQDHAAFIESVFRFAERLESDDAKIHSKVVTFIEDWYAMHILGDDQEYKNLLSLEANGSIE
jgi:hemerythrin